MKDTCNPWFKTLCCASGTNQMKIVTFKYTVLKTRVKIFHSVWQELPLTWANYGVPFHFKSVIYALFACFKCLGTCENSSKDCITPGLSAGMTFYTLNALHSLFYCIKQSHQYLQKIESVNCYKVSGNQVDNVHQEP